MRSVALITHDFSGFTGSEIVVMEVANYFAESGALVTIRAERHSDALAPYLHKNVTIAQNRIDIADYDLIWDQHGHFTLNTRDLNRLKDWNGIFISAHLSSLVACETYHYPFTSRYAGGLIFNAKKVADTFLANATPIGHWMNFKNAAPPYFHTRPKKDKCELKSILVVSNHAPQEVLEAMQLLKNSNLDVRHLGVAGEYCLIQPEDIQNTDAVVTIGKSVQYALVGGKPVYCYDHFGGPGWLLENNFQNAEDENFSGRCTPNRKTAQQIKDDIIDNYTVANNFIHDNWIKYHKSYHLYNLLDEYMFELNSKKISNHFNDPKCFEEINAMRGALIHVSWIWEDVYSKNSSNAYLSEITVQHNNEIADIKKDLLACTSPWIFDAFKSPWRISKWNKKRKTQDKIREKYR